MEIAEVIQKYDSIRNELDLLLPEIRDNVFSCLKIKKVEHIDHIASRIKSRDSFVEKSQKIEDEKTKYPNPFKEIQDLIGIRVIVYFLSDVAPVVEVLEKGFRRIEEKDFVPETPKDFDYQGKHIIAMIPPELLVKYCTASDENGIS